jgi:hypothetical protein
MSFSTLNKMKMLVPFCALALIGCDAGVVDGGGEVDAELSVQEAALLPPGEEEVDATELAAAEPATAENDAATFDTDEAFEEEDVAVDDDAMLAEMQAADLDGAAGVTEAAPPLATPSGNAPILAKPLLHWGIHPRASDAFRAAGVASWRIMQTIGNAAASAGTHRQDGTVNGHPYCAATDISVRGLSHAQIRNLLERLGRVGFAAWFRWPGHDHWPSGSAPHIHAVYANARMKSMLRSQVRSWLVGRNGLAYNQTYAFYRWSATAKSTVRHKFAQSGSGSTNSGSSCVPGGYYCGGDKISGNHSTLYRCTGSGAPAKVRVCSRGCAVRSGQNDACK